jgi:hypothetical protein
MTRCLFRRVRSTVAFKAFFADHFQIGGAGPPNAVYRPRPSRLLHSARSRRASAVTVGRPGGEPFVDFSLNPGDSMITNGYRLGELASLYLPSQVVAAIPDALLRPKPFEVDNPQGSPPA